ncbi:MAG: MlaD family protein [Pseudomonadota bacterium]
METRAHHLLIGAFTLLMVGALFGFIIWLAKVDIDKETKLYDVFFTASVTGLSQGGSVRLNGVPVGTVREIALDPVDPGLVRVRIEIDAKVPVNEGTEAVLESLGLTGVGYVQLKGGGATAPPLTAKPGQEVPVIPSGTSAIQDLFSGAPNLIDAAITTMGRVQAILDEENEEHITQILGNLDTFTGGLEESTDEVVRILEALDETVADFRSAAGAINRFSGTAENVVDQELRTLLSDASDLITSAESLSNELRVVVQENRGQLNNFTETALPEATLLLKDLRVMSRSLGRLAERLEASPLEALFNNKIPEHEGAN